MFLAANCLDVDFAGTHNHMQIDLASVEALELIKPLAAGAVAKKGTGLYRYKMQYASEKTVANPKCCCLRVFLRTHAHTVLSWSHFSLDMPDRKCSWGSDDSHRLQCLVWC